jgi:hypothetical protein
VDGDLAALAELAVDHPDQLPRSVDVITGEADRLADPDAGDGHQPDHRLRRRRMQLAAQPSRRAHHPLDVRRRKEERDRPLAAIGQ